MLGGVVGGAFDTIGNMFADRSQLGNSSGAIGLGTAGATGGAVGFGEGLVRNPVGRRPAMLKPRNLSDFGKNAAHSLGKGVVPGFALGLGLTLPNILANLLEPCPCD
jgi:hypothetical protein